MWEPCTLTGSSKALFLRGTDCPLHPRLLPNIRARLCKLFLSTHQTLMTLGLPRPVREQG